MPVRVQPPSAGSGSGTLRGDWAPGMVLALNDMVRNGGLTYYTITPHTTGASFDGNKFSTLPAAATPSPDALIPAPAWLQESVATEPSSEGIWQVTRDPIRYKQPTRLIVVDTLAKAQSSGSTTTKALVTDDVPLYGVAGAGVVEVSVASPSAGQLLLTFTAVDMTNKHFRFPFRVKGRDKISGYMQFDFAADTAAFTAGNYGTVRLGHATDNHLVSDFFPMHSINPQDAVFVGTATSAIFSSIGAIRIRVTPSGGTTSFCIPWLDAQPQGAAKAQVILSFDDAGLAHWTDAANLLAPYGFPAVIFPNMSEVDSTANALAMRLSQVRHLNREHGWQVGTHAYSNTEHNTTASGDALTQQLLRSKQLGRVAGFKGLDDFAWWGGLALNKDTYNRVRREFRSGRYNQNTPVVVESMPPADPWRIRAWLTATTDTAADWIAYVDRARACKGVAYFVIHNNVTGAEATKITTLCDYLKTVAADTDVATADQAWARLAA
jgi:peptidoglycan/xylan/chitin deacetylase (PgdA/CDA1 family)